MSNEFGKWDRIGKYEEDRRKLEASLKWAVATRLGKTAVVINQSLSDKDLVRQAINLSRSNGDLHDSDEDDKVVDFYETQRQQQRMQLR